MSEELTTDPIQSTSRFADDVKMAELRQEALHRVPVRPVNPAQRVKVKLLSSAARAPRYQTPGSAGADIYASEEVILHPGQPTVVGTGLSMAIPRGFEVQLRLRSSLGAKGLIIPNAPGTIDSDYRGEIKGILINLTDRDFVIHEGDRIMQAVLAPVSIADFRTVDELDETSRGAGGMGSTGQ